MTDEKKDGLIPGEGHQTPQENQKVMNEVKAPAVATKCHSCGSQWVSHDAIVEIDAYVERRIEKALAAQRSEAARPAPDAGLTADRDKWRRRALALASAMGMEDSGVSFDEEIARLRTAEDQARSGAMIRERDATTVLAAVVAKAGGEVRLTERNMIDAFGLTLEMNTNRLDSGRTYRTQGRIRERDQHAVDDSVEAVEGAAASRPGVAHVDLHGVQAGKEAAPVAAVPVTPNAWPTGVQCRICVTGQRFAMLDLDTGTWLPGWCDAHGDSMLRPYENSVVQASPSAAPSSWPTDEERAHLITYPFDVPELGRPDDNVKAVMSLIAAVRRETVEACAAKLEEDHGWDASDFMGHRIFADEMGLMGKWLRIEMAAPKGGAT